MKATSTVKKAANSKGAPIFRKMLADKALVSQHLKSGGKVADLRKKITLVKTVSIKGA
ncbi:MAG TPA: hypothetical protein PLJ08_15295 [Cyclobacteriaceae bacterium]|jgi:hypothetical protein|nr:hypothetical protein [Cyclobacteriaceae bacterium]